MSLPSMRDRPLVSLKPGPYYGAVFQDVLGTGTWATGWYQNPAYRDAVVHGYRRAGYRLLHKVTARRKLVRPQTAPTQ